MLATRRLTAGLYVCVIFTILFGIPTFLSNKSQALQSQQHGWIGDVPIMDALSVEPALGFAFDSPNGRIVMIFASSKATFAEIMNFYNKSLLAIGWLGGDGEWHRGSEKLIISEVRTTAGLLWRLMVQPQ